MARPQVMRPRPAPAPTDSTSISCAARGANSVCVPNAAEPSCALPHRPHADTVRQVCASRARPARASNRELQMHHTRAPQVPDTHPLAPWHAGRHATLARQLFSPSDRGPPLRAPTGGVRTRRDAHPAPHPRPAPPPIAQSLPAGRLAPARRGRRYGRGRLLLRARALLWRRKLRRARRRRRRAALAHLRADLARATDALARLRAAAPRPRSQLCV
eukprot:5225490-Prymnesium_polylepis.1